MLIKTCEPACVKLGSCLFFKRSLIQSLSSARARECLFYRLDLREASLVCTLNIYFPTCQSLVSILILIFLQTSNWEWKLKDSSIKIHYEEHGVESNAPKKNILMMPTISDVSTVEEWRLVAKDIIQRAGNANWRATIVDWPGLGYSDRPKLVYNADVMESFLVDFILDPNSPINRTAEDLVIVGGGHAATLAVRAAKKGLIKPTAIAAVAPTWSGPLPIVFGRDAKTESR